MAKSYRVIQIKLNQLVLENVHMTTDLPTKRFKRYLSDKNFSDFLPTRWPQKSTGIDMEQNYVTITLCITWPAGVEWVKIYHVIRIKFNHVVSPKYPT